MVLEVIVLLVNSLSDYLLKIDYYKRLKGARDMDPNTVYLLEDVFLKTLDNPCLYYQVGKPIAKNILAFGLRKGFKYSTTINKALIDFHTDGNIKYLDKRWFSDIDENLCNDMVSKTL